MRLSRRRLAGSLLAVVLALVALAGPAQAASTPLVDLVHRFVPGHAALDAARGALAQAVAVSGGDSPGARAAARAYAHESDLHAGRIAATAVATTDERTLRDAMADANRDLSADLRAYASGRIDHAELERRSAEGRRRAAAEIAPLLAAVAADQGLDESLDGASLARHMAPVALLILGVVGLAAFTRRGSAGPRSRTS